MDTLSGLSSGLRALLLAGAGLAAACSSPADGPTGDARLAAEAREAARTDPSRLSALLDGIADPGLRDLVTLDLVRQHRLDLCDRIRTPTVRDDCRSVLGRPHLAATTRVPADPGATDPVRSGPDDPSADLDILRAVARGDVPDGGCERIADPGWRTACLVERSHRVRAAGDFEGARAACAAVPAVTWRQECAFALAEEARKQPWTWRFEVCTGSGSFAPGCRAHLLDQAAWDLLQTRSDGSFDALADALAAVVEAAGRVDPSTGTGEAGWTLWARVLARVALAGDLPAWRGYGLPLAPDDPTRLALDVLLPATWAADLAGSTPTTLADLETGWSAVAAAVPPRPPTVAPVLAGGNAAANRIGDPSQRLPGRIPWPLGACPLDDGARTRLGLLWGARAAGRAVDVGDMLRTDPALTAWWAAPDRTPDAATRAGCGTGPLPVRGPSPAAPPR